MLFFLDKCTLYPDKQHPVWIITLLGKFQHFCDNFLSNRFNLSYGGGSKYPITIKLIIFKI